MCVLSVLGCLIPCWSVVRLPRVSFNYWYIFLYASGVSIEVAVVAVEAAGSRGKRLLF